MPVATVDKKGKRRPTKVIVKELQEEKERIQDCDEDPFSFLEKSFPESSYLGNENTLAIPNFLIRGSNGMRKPFLYQYLFDKITWIGAGISKIGDSAFSSGCKIVNAKKGVPIDKKAGDYPAVTFLKELFANPNNDQTFLELYKQVIIDLCVNGKGYFIIEFLEDTPPFRTPIAIYRADFRCMRPVYLHDYLIYNQNIPYLEAKKYKNKIVMWCQEVIEGLESFVEVTGKAQNPRTPWIVGNGTNVKYFYPEQVLEIKLYANGVSPLESLEDSIATEIAAKKYTYSYFKNATKTGMVLTLEKGSAADAKQNKEWLMNEYSKPAGAWKPLFLLGGVKMVASGANTSDVQYLEIRAFNKTECCAATGVPESMFGDGNEEDTINFENNTVVPKENLVLMKLQKKFEDILPWFKGSFVIQSGRKSKASYHMMKIAQLQAMIGGSVNENRELIKLPPKDGEEYDDACLASNIMPVKMLKKTIESKNNSIGPKVVRDNFTGQRRDENIQGGKSGITNEQR